jgi:RNA polymerase sigma-70 factor, ECF subfamily
MTHRNVCPDDALEKDEDRRLADMERKGEHGPAMGQDRAALEGRIRKHLERGQLAEAATQALKGYGPEVMGYLVSVLRDRCAASDVFADFSEDLWKGIAGFRKESSFRTWAYRLAWNAAQMYWRDPYRRHVRRLATSEYSLVAERLRVSSLRQDPRAAADRLAKLRESLKPEEQTLLILRVDKGLSWKEIALVLAEAEDAPPDVGALRKRFERLKERLLRLAKKEGVLEYRPR